jgi:hypothetical protein
MAMNKMPVQRYQRIILLSHMRAYSSLIGHILGSHPQINGYYEMHLCYTSAADLDQQLRLYMQTETPKPGSIYLFDKLLHNDYALDTHILAGSGNRLLMSIRSPGSSLKSIIHLFQSKQGEQPYADPDQATDYYIQRLKSLADFSRMNTARYYYFDAELIKTDSRNLLQALTRWCELTPPLSDRYQTFPLTGKARASDSSELISRGKIETSENDYPGVRLEAQHMLRAEQAYAEYREVILGNARDSLTL